MAKKKWISKGTTYQLVHRAQNDPKIHDDSASPMVFQEVAPPQVHKIKSRNDLESELFGGSEAGDVDSLPGIRDNEGEAAEYGIYYDDTEYDYMQHMRELGGGDGSGESYFVEANIKPRKGNGKNGVKLEDALRAVSLEEPETKASDGRLMVEDILPSKNMKKVTYQDQQDVPDELAGFQPDMDPRLREVLEALEDEAYVDDDEDIFGELAQDGGELTLEEFEELGELDDEAGWESDHTAKPNKEYNIPSDPMPVGDTKSPSDTDPSDGDDGWMAEFSKFKNASKVAKKDKAMALSNAEIQSSIMSGTSMIGGRRKKRKGALTSSTGYSMTSSSIYRTEGLTLLDARFDKIEAEYAADDDDMPPDSFDDNASIMTGRMSNASRLSMVSRSSTSSSQAPNLVMRGDFDMIMDEFLDGHSMSGKKHVKKGRYQTGMQQLDEVRKELGWVPGKKTGQKVAT